MLVKDNSNQKFSSMLKIILLTLLFLGIHSVPSAYVFQAGMDDKERIVIAPAIGQDVEISGQAGNLLMTTMSNIINLNGLAARENGAFFSLMPQISVVSEQVTATAPPMHAVTLNISFTIVDKYSGAVFGETNLEVRGVDQSRERAFTHAISNVNPRAGQFKVFMERAKDDILAFYDTECELVISAAKSLAERGRKREAIEVLTSVPPVSRECFDLCMELAGEIGPVPEAITEQRQHDPEPGQETTVAEKLEGRIRNLEVQLLHVKFTGNDLDIKIMLMDREEHANVNLRRSRFIDQRGKEFRRNHFMSVDLVRGVSTQRTLKYRDANIDLVEFLRVLEFEFRGLGTMRFENIEVKR